MHSKVYQLPIESDFIHPRSRDLDERHAVKTFLGKTPEQAEAMFARNFLFYQEDLTYMLAPAFCFYVRSAICYLVSDAAAGDSDAASTFCYLLEDRFKREPETVLGIKDVVLSAIQHVVAKFESYECSPEIYGDVPARYRELAHWLDAQSTQTMDGPVSP